MNDSTTARPWCGNTPGFSICRLAAVAVAFISTTAAAQDDDVVIFNNGDRLTGEIRGLSRGQLSFNTDATGTIQVEWNQVAELRASETYEIELASGVRYLGSLPAPEEQGELNVDVGGTQPLEISFTRVVAMTQIEATFRDRIDVDVNFGYNFTKSSDVEQLTLGFDVAYQAEEHLASARVRTIRTDKGDEDESTDQATLDLVYAKLLRNRWFASGLTGFESNSELGIDLRTTVGGGVGRVLSQSGGHRVALLTGLLQTKEDVVDSAESRTSVEGLINLAVDWYRSDDKEFDISSRLSFFPGISESGRYRTDLDLALEWELFGDITWGLTFYHKFDTDPPSVDAANADYGIITSVGVDF